MTVIAYDSSHPIVIPQSAGAIFPYSDGHYHWSHLLLPKAQYRYITCTGGAGADIADFEPGCIWPGSALRSWAERRQALHPGSDLTVYTGRDNFAAASDAMTGFTWHLGLATLDGSQPLEFEGKPCRFVQFTDRGGLFDLSIVHDTGWLNQP